MPYSSAAIFGSEAIATCVAIYLGESIIANELLSKTKGKAMGWGFVALGFGLSFGVAILMFSYISAHVNPATCLALVILGKMTGVNFAAAVGGEFLGAFVGACLVWLHYLPHFKSIPEPPAADAADLLLRSRDAPAPSSLGIASYNTREDDVAARQRGIGDITRAVKDTAGYLGFQGAPNMDRRSSLVEIALGPTELKGADGAEELFSGGLRRRSVQVCDVHRRLKDMDMDEYRLMLAAAQGGPIVHSASTGTLPQGSAGDLRRVRSAGEGEVPHPHEKPAEKPPAAPAAPVHPAVENRQRRLDRLYDAAVVADQNSKLSIFSTRPAIYSPLHNFLCEFLCTTALVYGALMIYERRDQMYGPERLLFRGMEGLIIGFFVFVCILGLGGPTGIAANPARDFSPRVAHWILPIPGKGPSEFYYSWIPVVAPFVGGCAAAGLYAATELMNNSDVAAISFPNLPGA